MKTFCILYVLYTVFFHYSKLEKESIFKEIIGKREYIYLLIEKKPHVTGPTPFKPVLFKDQLYLVSS